MRGAYELYEATCTHGRDPAPELWRALMRASLPVGLALLSGAQLDVEFLEGSRELRGRDPALGLDRAPLAIVHPLVMHVVTTEGRGIEKMADLKGKRVGIPREYRIDGVPEEINALWDRGIEWLETPGGTLAGPSRFNHMNWGITELQGLSMLSGQSRPESGETQLPLTTWIIPVVTGVIVLLAVATALA